MTLQSIRRVVCVALAVCTFAMFAQAGYGQGLPRQPYLGFDGYVVDLPAHLGFPRDIKGMKVRSVRWGSPAARAGLERGDILVTIDAIAFRNNGGYMQALRMASQQPSLIVVNVRNGRLTRTSCRLPHIESNEELNANVEGLAIDLEEDMRDW